MKMNKALFAAATAVVLLASCSSKNQPKNFSVVKYVSVADNKAEADAYVFDGMPLLEYDGSFYRHVDSATYLNNNIQQLDLFKPMGAYSIEQKDLLADTLLMSSFDIAKDRNIKMEAEKITDNNKELSGKLMQEGKFAATKGLYLYIYSAIEQ